MKEIEEAKKIAKDVYDKVCPIIIETAYKVDRGAFGEHIGYDIGESIGYEISKKQDLSYDERRKQIEKYRYKYERSFGMILRNSKSQDLFYDKQYMKEMIEKSLPTRIHIDNLDEIMNADMCTAGLELLRYWCID